MTQASEPILIVSNLQVWFYTRRGIGKAVDGVSFHLARGETLGLVGESASGKSITALSILGMNPRPASKVIGGSVVFDGTDLTQLDERELVSLRGTGISMILQDPMTALDPVYKVGTQITEGVEGRSRDWKASRAEDMLRRLRVPDAATRLHAYPHQLSGGMRQRVVGAAALAGEPKVLIADEPTTSLDVTVQAAYLALLQQIQRDSGLAILFITHDLGVVGDVCDRVAVMYAGRIVETARTESIFENPSHPYTQALLKSVPTTVDPDVRLQAIEGEPPSIFNMPPGCPFAARCEYAMDICRREYPPTVSDGDASVDCWLHVERPHG